MPDTIILKFPISDGGEETGLNNPGTEIFRGRIADYLARECAQNTADAAKDGHAELCFSLLEVSVGDLPCSNELKSTLAACGDYWQDDSKSKAFFTKAQSFLGEGNVKVLKISDYGTTGLTGRDDDTQSSWYGLVRSSGVSNKGAGSAGSYGIGKFAPFAASGIQTVYYASKSDDGFAFQGVSRLVTHRGSDGEKTQGTGYIGIYDPSDKNAKFKALRDGDIPELFGRTEHGTDIYIPAYLPAYEDHSTWKDRLIVSIINSFWLSVCLEKISFKISDIIINQSNIDDMIQKYKAHTGFEAYKFYDAYRNGQVFREKIDKLGDVEFRIVERRHKERPPVTYARGSGMSIGYWGYFRSRKPFSGVFICHGKDGNEVLRQMEPPRHDVWETSRHPEGDSIIASVKQWIKECITTMFPVGETDTFEIDALSRYLQADDEELGEESFDENKEKDNEDGFAPTPAEPKKNITKTWTPPAAPDDDGELAEEPSDDTGNGGSGGTEGDGGVDPKGGDGKKTGGKQTPGGGSGDEGNTKTSSVRFIASRCFYDTSDGSYHVILRAKKAFAGKVSFAAECDDGSSERLKIVSALAENGQTVALSGGNNGLDIELEPDTAVKFKICFEQKDKMSVRVI